MSEQAQDKHEDVFHSLQPADDLKFWQLEYTLLATALAQVVHLIDLGAATPERLQPAYALLAHAAALMKTIDPGRHWDTKAKPK
jgi:hypothetical protein